MIRILHSVSNMDRAGIETMLMNYYRNINKNEFQFDFLCNKSKNGSYENEIKLLGGNIYKSPGFNPLKIIKYINCLKKIKKQNPDIKIFHAHNAALSAYSLFCAKMAGYQIRIAHSHSTKIPSANSVKFLDFKWIYKTLLKRYVCRESTFNIACGNEAGKFLFSKANYEIINNAIITNKYIFDKDKRIKIRKMYKLDDDIVLIGHVGRFNIVKNHVFMLKIFKELKKNSNIKYRMIFIGDGELKKSIINLSKKMKIYDDIIFVDNISNVNDYYSAMDIFLLPSKFEGIPVVGIEAQVAGLKCIFSNNISSEAKISNLVSFINICDDISVKEWVKKILDSNVCLEHRNDFKLYKEYNIEHNVKKLEKIYMQLLYQEKRSKNEKEYKKNFKTSPRGIQGNL